MIDLGKFSDSIKILQSEPIEIKVARLRWDGPHKPVFSWETYKYLPKDSSDGDIQKVIKELIKRKKYFKKCQVCSEVKLAGHLNGDVCHHCMEKDGIVF
jgi:hypothetical protein